MKTGKSVRRNRSIDWHSGFAGGLELSFRRYRDGIEIEREYPLSKKPLSIDFLIIKKRQDLVIDNAVGQTFRRINLIEFKNPNDSLNIDVVWKCIGYAGIYKSLGRRVNEIPASEMTLSIFRNRTPKKLFRQLSEDGQMVTNPFPGVYRITGLVPFPIQIVNPNELESRDFLALKIMKPNADIDEVRNFLSEARQYREQGDCLDADAVLQVSTSGNMDLYAEVMEDGKMCEALRELMKKDLDEAEDRGRKNGREEGREEGRKEGREEGRKEGWKEGRVELQSEAQRMKDQGYTADQILKELKLL